MESYQKFAVDLHFNKFREKEKKTRSKRYLMTHYSRFIPKRETWVFLTHDFSCNYIWSDFLLEIYQLDLRNGKKLSKSKINQREWE